MKKIFLVFTLLFTLSCSTHVNSCLETRAALDVGSGSTRFLVAEVDTCQAKIVDELYKEEVSVPYRDSLVNGELNVDIQEKGSVQLARFVDKGKALGAAKFFAVGTEVFRRAKNGASFVRDIESKLGLKIEIIDQEYEARLGYAGVLAKQQGNTRKEPFVVWDVGGGSTQIIARDANGFNYFFPKVGSVSFKEHIIEKIQNKKIDKTKSPNPIGSKSAARAEKYLTTKIKSEIPVWLKSALASGVNVYGIGGVHNYSIKGQVKNDSAAYSYEEVEKTLVNRLNLTDTQIGGEYANTEISNLILVKSMMRTLGINSVVPVKVNLTEGLIVQ